MILEHDGRLRRIVNKDTGLQDENVYTGTMDRDGLLWLGLSRGIARVDVNSPINVFSTVGNTTARFKDALYFGAGVGGKSLFRVSTDPITGQSSPQPLHFDANQAFTLSIFRDPTGKGADQLLAGTSAGVAKIEGNSASPVLPALKVETGVTVILPSRKFPNRIWAGDFGNLSSLRWEGGALGG